MPDAKSHKIHYSQAKHNQQLEFALENHKSGKQIFC
jgi:hypothetical protein